MAGLDLFAVQDVIAAHVRATFPAYDVVEDEVIDDDYVLRLDNNVKPFIFLRWGSLNRSVNNGSFAGVRYDEYTSTVDIGIIAPNPRIARKASNMITDTLTGWKVEGITALTPDISGTWAVVDGSSRPHLYVATTRFTYAVNFGNVGDYITP